MTTPVKTVPVSIIILGISNNVIAESLKDAIAELTGPLEAICSEWIGNRRPEEGSSREVTVEPSKSVA